MDPTTRQTWVNRAIKTDLLDVQPNIAWIDGMVLDQLICKVTKEGWLVIVKAHKGRHQRAAFISAATYPEALELAAEFSARGCLTWQHDKWPPKVTS